MVNSFGYFSRSVIYYGFHTLIFNKNKDPPRIFRKKIKTDIFGTSLTANIREHKQYFFFQIFFHLQLAIFLLRLYYHFLFSLSFWDLFFIFFKRTSLCILNCKAFKCLAFSSFYSISSFISSFLHSSFHLAMILHSFSFSIFNVLFNLHSLFSHIFKSYWISL